MADGLRIRVESYFGSSRLPASRMEGGRGERTPHTPHPTLNTCIHTPLLRLEHPPQSSRVPFRPHIFSSVHPSITLRQGGATGLPKGEQEGRRTISPTLSRTAPSTFTAHPKPCRAGEGRSTTTGAAAPPSPHASLLFPIAFTPLQAFCIASSRIQPLLLLSTSHTPSSPDTIGRPPSRGPFAVPL